MSERQGLLYKPTVTVRQLSIRAGTNLKHVFDAVPDSMRYGEPQPPPASNRIDFSFSASLFFLCITSVTPLVLILKPKTSKIHHIFDMLIIVYACILDLYRPTYLS